MGPTFVLQRAWVALLVLGLVGCGSESAPTSPSSPAPTGAIVFSCRIGSGSCADAMQGQTVTFSAQRGSVSLRSARIEFGDGREQDLGALPASAEVTHEYMQVGTFTARLLTVDAAGQGDSATQVIRVGTLVTSSLGVTNEGGLNVSATARVDGAVVTLYEWFFEGPTANVATTVPQARYTFSSTGFKDIAMRATLADGRVIRVTAAVVVE